MPRKPQWLHRLPAILEQLERLDTPTVDRSVIQELFQLQRRRAVALLHHFSGGYQSGRTFQIDRLKLIAQLKDWVKGRAFVLENHRFDRLTEQLRKTRQERRAQPVFFAVKSEVFGIQLPDLPDGVWLKPGTITVQFSSTEEALQKLFTLAQAISNDFDTFSRAIRLE